jgi:hypothetical protein
MVAAAVEAGGVPKRWARGSVLRGGGQGVCMCRRAGGEDRSRRALCRHRCPVRCVASAMVAGMEVGW